MGGVTRAAFLGLRPLRGGETVVIVMLGALGGAGSGAGVPSRFSLSTIDIIGYSDGYCDEALQVDNMPSSPGSANELDEDICNLRPHVA